jgi:hypothetical protein
MSRDDDVVGGEIDTPIAFAISRVSEEDTISEPGGAICGHLVQRGWDRKHSRTNASALKVKLSYNLSFKFNYNILSKR